jgi:predicted lipoprotein with Yx(FWY)xxD motif
MRRPRTEPVRLAAVPASRRPRWGSVALALSLAVAALATGCSAGGSGESATAGTASPVTVPASIGPPPSAASPSGTSANLPTDTVAVTLMSTPLGDVLADGRTGRTLYAFRSDGRDAPTCVAACARLWVPVTGTQIGIAAGLDYRPGEFKLVARPGGGPRQLSVAGHPLYRYAGDTLAGQTRGQGALHRWFAVGADGQPITSS